MARWSHRWIAAGSCLVVVGGLLLVPSWLQETAARPVSVPAGTVDRLSAPSSSLGDAAFTASWSHSAPGTNVYLITGTATCEGVPAGLSAAGSGASGSIRAEISPGHTYVLYACNGASGESIIFEWTATGWTAWIVLGLVLVALGSAVIVIGIRRTSPAAPPPTGR